VIDGTVPPGAREITTGQANRVWYINGTRPYILKHYTDPGRAANETAALTLLAAHHTPAPRLIAAQPDHPQPWTAQTTVHGEPVPAGELLHELADALAAVHRIPGPHAGRLAGSRRHPTWPAYLHDRLNAYTAAAPHLAADAATLHHTIDTQNLDIEPRLVHHDLQPGHLIRHPDGTHVLIDWELAAYGDPLSDLARLAVRLALPDPTPCLALTPTPDPTAHHRLHLYWHIHHLARTALGTNRP